jgi:hypothetical protein
LQLIADGQAALDCCGFGLQNFMQRVVVVKSGSGLGSVATK